METERLSDYRSAYETGPNTDLPREKAFANGIMSLNDHELLMVILGSGIRGKPVSAIAEETIKVLDSVNFAETRVTMDTFLGIDGLGPAKACTISAAFELCRRYTSTARICVKNPTDVHNELRHYGNRTQEHFFSISLNGGNEIINIRTVSRGLVNRTMVHPREVFSGVIKDNAVAAIVAHNHPSGNLEPSKEDKDVTQNLVHASGILGIQLLDHIIFSREGFFSFMEGGLL